MGVNGVNGGYNYVKYMSKAEVEAKEKAKTGKASEEETTEKAATTTEAEKTESAAPKKAEEYKPDMEKINSMKADLKNNIMAFKQMVFAQVKDQGAMASKADNPLAELLKNISPEEAQANISEGGYWSVDSTANRILDFAKALSGGDPSKIGVLKDAVLKGFEAAEKVWGSKLPDISYETKQKVLEGFDAWEKEGQTSTVES